MTSSLSSLIILSFLIFSQPINIHFLASGWFAYFSACCCYFWSNNCKIVQSSLHFQARQNKCTPWSRLAILTWRHRLSLIVQRLEPWPKSCWVRYSLFSLPRRCLVSFFPLRLCEERSFEFNLSNLCKIFEGSQFHRIFFLLPYLSIRSCDNIFRLLDWGCWRQQVQCPARFVSC